MRLIGKAFPKYEAHIIGFQDALCYPKLPVVLMEDFNAEPESRVVAIAKEAGLWDTAAAIPGTFHSVCPERGANKIDYIFTNARWEETIALTDNEDGVFLSDHYPVMTKINL